MEMRRAALATPMFLLAHLVAACAGSQPSTPAALPPAAPAVLPPAAPASPPPVAAPTEPGCDLTLRTTASAIEGGTYELIATLTNETSASITATWSAPCPGPAATFDGLPGAYDYGSACTAGACREAVQITTLTIPPHGTASAAHAVISPGGNACNAPLPTGTYSVSASLAIAGARVCDVGRGVVVGTGAPEPLVRHHEPAVPRAPTPQQPPEQHERCPAVACAYSPCPPGVAPPTGCAAACGCPNRGRDSLGPDVLRSPR